MYGIAPSTIGRTARALAAVTGDAAWYEEATKRLLATGGTEGEAVSLLRGARAGAAGAAQRPVDGAGRALRPRWPKAHPAARGCRALARGVPPRRRPKPPPDADPERTVARAGGRSRAALEALAGLETDPALARGLSRVALPLRALEGGDSATARKQAHELADKDASDTLVATIAADMDRAADDHAAAARVAADAAAATTDAELGAALHFEAGFERWRSDDRKGALEEFEAGLQHAPDAAKMLLAWASRGVDVDSIAARRRAIERAVLAEWGGRLRVLALERFAIATEAGGGDPDDAAAGARRHRPPPGGRPRRRRGPRAARVVGLAAPPTPTRRATRCASRGPGPAGGSCWRRASKVRLARDADDAQELARAASRWFDAGGGLAAAIEWLAAASVLGQPAEDKKARLGVAAALSGERARGDAGERRAPGDADPPLRSGAARGRRVAGRAPGEPGALAAGQRSATSIHGARRSSTARWARTSAIDAASLGGVGSVRRRRRHGSAKAAFGEGGRGRGRADVGRRGRGCARAASEGVTRGCARALRRSWARGAPARRAGRRTGRRPRSRGWTSGTTSTPSARWRAASRATRTAPSPSTSSSAGSGTGRTATGCSPSSRGASR